MFVRYDLPISHNQRTIIPGLFKSVVSIGTPIGVVLSFPQHGKFIFQISVQERQQTYDWQE